MSTVEELVQELESARLDLTQLSLRVDSVEQSMKALKPSVDTMIMTLKRIIKAGFSDKVLMM